MDEKIIGREYEKKILKSILSSPSAELLALYGRRRVGKTHLIREFFHSQVEIFFTATGQRDTSTTIQLFHFKQEIEKIFYNQSPLPQFKNWDQAIKLLCDVCQNELSKRKVKNIVLFFDELPWLSTPKSNFLQTLEYYWNTRLSQIPQIKLIACGSAASWMIEKLIYAKGGLHNRITRQIRLEPFTLSETKIFLEYRGIYFKPIQILEIYMAFGGIPYYLQLIERGYSAAQNIGNICFEKAGPLSDEYNKLFLSLFNNAQVHEKIIRIIAQKREGILRGELINKLKISSGGRLNQRLKELEEAGFIISFSPYGKKKKYISYRIIDEYVNFYLRWIESAPIKLLHGDSINYWIQLANSQSFRSWAGYTFEGICLKHIKQIREKLGINSTATEIGTWRCISNKNDRDDHGAQIDLLFDRNDGIITLCEIKFKNKEFAIDKLLAKNFKRKVDIFLKQTKVKKQIFLALITTYGLKSNIWSEDLIHNVVTLNDLLK